MGVLCLSLNVHLPYHYCHNSILSKQGREGNCVLHGIEIEDPAAFLQVAKASDFKTYLEWRRKNLRITRQQSMYTCQCVLSMGVYSQSRVYYARLYTMCSGSIQIFFYRQTIVAAPFSPSPLPLNWVSRSSSLVSTLQPLSLFAALLLYTSDSAYTMKVSSTRGSVRIAYNTSPFVAETENRSSSAILR